MYKRLLQFLSLLLCLTMLPTSILAASPTTQSKSAHEEMTVSKAMPNKEIAPMGNMSDRIYLSAMIIHHQDAVDMSKKILKSSSDEKIIAWAKAIISDQQKEIKVMEALLVPMGGMDKEAGAAMQYMNMTENKNLSADKAFVALMLIHHKEALDMAANALLTSNNSNVLDLSQAILVGQTNEMREFKKWQGK